MNLESCQTIEEAMDIANQSGTPHQNFVVADSNGRIGWTIMGESQSDEGSTVFSPFHGLMAKRLERLFNSDEYPRVIDPAVGRIWTANARVVSDDAYRTLGDSGYDRGARQQQIRDALLKIEQATEADMLALQLDKRALLLERWRGVLIEVLKSEKGSKLSSAPKVLEIVQQWDGKATADSVGYRIVWAFRNRVATEMGNFLSRIAKEHDDKFSLTRHRRIEESIWELLQQRPEHYLDPAFSDWDHFLVEQYKVVQQDIDKTGSVEKFKWGLVNTTNIQHPMSMAIPFVGAWIDMPKRELDGGWSDIPFIQAPSMGLRSAWLFHLAKKGTAICTCHAGNRGILFLHTMRIVTKRGSRDKRPHSCQAHR